MLRPDWHVADQQAPSDVPPSAVCDVRITSLTGDTINQTDSIAALRDVECVISSIGSSDAHDPLDWVVTMCEACGVRVEVGVYGSTPADMVAEQVQSVAHDLLRCWPASALAHSTAAQGI